MLVPFGATRILGMLKIQNRACRYFLGVNAKTPLSALHGDMETWVGQDQNIECT